MTARRNNDVGVIAKSGVDATFCLLGDFSLSRACEEKAKQGVIIAI